MSTQRSGTSSRRWLASLAAVCTLASLTVTPTALADNPTSSAPADSTSQQQTPAPSPAPQQTPVTGEGQATADITSAATTQDDVDKATSALELRGTITTNLTISKKLAITAAEGTVVKGSITLQNDADGTTITGVHFLQDSTTSSLNSLMLKNVDNVKIQGNTFEIANDADEKKQLNSVWIEGGSDNTVIGVEASAADADGQASQAASNTFNIAMHPNYQEEGKGFNSQSWDGVNLVGSGTNPIKNTIISGNTMTVTPMKSDAGSTGTGSSEFVVGNGNTADTCWGIEGLKVLGNIITDGTNLGGQPKVYGVVVTAVKDVEVAGNTMNGGYAMLSYSTYGTQRSNDGVTFNDNTISSFVGALMGDKVAEGGMKASGNTFDAQKTTYPFNGAAVRWSGPDGTLYSSVEKALERNVTSLTLQQNIAENVTIPEDKNVTLDLNGHTLTNKVEDTKTDHTITNNGTLTVKDSIGGGTVDNVSNGKGALENTGTATIEGGKFTRSKEASTSATVSGGNTWYVIDNNGGTLTVNDGTVTNTSKMSSLVRNLNGTMTVNGGTFSNVFNTLKNDEGGTLNITNGTIISQDQAVQNWYNTTITGGTLTGSVIGWTYDNLPVSNTVIKGGTITGDVMAVNYKKDGALATNPPSVTVTGGTIAGKVQKGTYNGKITVVEPNASSSNILISGGNFTNAEKPNDKFLAPGFIINGNGSVTVPAPVPSEPTITGIEIASKPTKIEYKIGEAFDASGLKVNMRWSSGRKDALKPAQWIVSGFDSSKPGKVKVTVALAWDESKTASFEVTVKASDVVVRRLYNKASGEHFYTTSEQEVKAVLNSSKDWRDEGAAFTMGDWGREVWRLYHPGSGKHMYTASEAERDALAASGWRAEGVAFRQAEGAEKKVYRLYNTGNGDHLFTTNWLEYTALRILPWWRGEGVGFNAK